MVAALRRSVLEVGVLRLRNCFASRNYCWFQTDPLPAARWCPNLIDLMAWRPLRHFFATFAVKIFLHLPWENHEPLTAKNAENFAKFAEKTKLGHYPRLASFSKSSTYRLQWLVQQVISTIIVSKIVFLRICF
jgi:hypothetical protein